MKGCWRGWISKTKQGTGRAYANVHIYILHSVRQWLLCSEAAGIKTPPQELCQ